MQGQNGGSFVIEKEMVSIKPSYIFVSCFFFFWPL